MSDFKAKMHKIRFPLGLRPGPRWGSLQRSPDPLAVFKGHSSNGHINRRHVWAGHLLDAARSAAERCHTCLSTASARP